ncbi:MAG: DJ-1/PfpI family protein [Spirochaetaceae bacterium]|jgi:4-methyl-5(b-hydroxyethyl)-thiazole monophosphate biosynthesis|nr:DJ-1/PfpI family protein [Spirochaetaceae bacterium]
MQKKVILFLADGFEEVEALTPVDYLRRAGIEVTTVSVSANPAVRGAHGIPVMADSTLTELAGLGRSGAKSWDGVLLPGGMPGASNIAASEGASALLREMAGAGKLVCAICASPAVVLAPLGLLAGRRFTCFPGMEEKVSGARWSGDRVVVDGNIITSRAAGTAGAWAAAIIGKLAGENEAKKLAQSVLL